MTVFVSPDALSSKYRFETVNPNKVTYLRKDSIPLLRMPQSLIFGQDVAKSKHARRVREP